MAEKMQNTKGMKTLKSYMVGLILALILTLLSFHIASLHLDPKTAAHALSDKAYFWVMMLLAVIQLFVQVVCFLRINSSKEGRWELMPFLFTIFVVFVVVGGSMWIMWNLNYNMMH